jgi:hypothetical protein
MADDNLNEPKECQVVHEYPVAGVGGYKVLEHQWYKCFDHSLSIGLSEGVNEFIFEIECPSVNTLFE